MEYDQAPLPRYSTHPRAEPDVPPPLYYSKIGTKVLPQPLVSIPELKAHLRLLNGFAVMRKAVEEASPASLGFPDRQVITGDIDNERKWTLFVALAVERFELYVMSLSPTTVYLPPLDVFMVWHAYRLNPLRYAEDAALVPALSILMGAGSTLLYDLPLAAMQLTYPSQSNAATWTAKTGLPFDPIDSAAMFKTRYRSLQCPRCTSYCQAPYLDASGQGHGYLQKDFQHDCPNCGFGITKDTLAMVQKLKDLTGDTYLRTTLYSTMAPPDPGRAMAIKTNCISTRKLRPKKGSTTDAWIQKILERHKYDPARVTTAMSKFISGRDKKRPIMMMRRVASAYVDDKMFSLDLVGAVLRQASFVGKMVGLGWTAPAFSADPDETVLLHTIARYHAFLDLMQSSPASFFVPTLDIDLAWHTHQLKSAQYENDCWVYVGRFVDHNDRVEEDKLSNAFDITCRAWESRFHVQYTHCGCPVPGEKLHKRISRLLTGAKEPTSELVPPDRSDLRAATHPSDHNAVLLMSHQKRTEAARTRRLAKREERYGREDEEIRRGRLDETARVRRHGHDPAFIAAVPLVYMGTTSVGCVATGGHVVSCGSGGSGGCGASGCSAACAGAPNGGCGGGGCGGSGAGGCGGGGSGGCGGGGGGGCGGGGGGGGGGCGGGGGGGGGGC
ncbi:hypothetical protein CYLTODRAFT_374384 [Cylindrobasidium torrendii FP15055 ss-10]|uniref:Uncharacterized protein n=1 Tax=Cylindrobasidium torrendii FP15055 ss-10 TaxID=1314674 RepID=A0A0D7BFL3_9AGAR|nr:hypothetical protein CYLTODRAFT_374384 [Cylindrobasidium torrendii FP15055 ss-10]